MLWAGSDAQPHRSPRGPLGRLHGPCGGFPAIWTVQDSAPTVCTAGIKLAASERSATVRQQKTAEGQAGTAGKFVIKAVDGAAQTKDKALQPEVRSSS